MTDRYRVYTKVKKMLKQMMKLNHQGQVVTLAMMISGIVMSLNAQLSIMSSEIPTEMKEKSIEMRIRRLVKEDGTNVESVYMPFARQILEALSHLPLVMVMDGSQAGRGCMVLIAGVLYQKRALPIAWLVYRGKKGHATAEQHIQALEKALPLLPEGWVPHTRDWCKTNGAAFFWKQRGGEVDKGSGLNDAPADLRIREMPAALFSEASGP